MNLGRYELLLTDLGRLCGDPDPRGFFSYRNLRFQPMHGTGLGFTWVDVVVEIAELSEDDAIDTMVCALTMNATVIRKSPKPAWFAMSEFSPAIVLVQRFYGDALREQDLLNYLSEIGEFCTELKQQITAEAFSG